MSPLPTFTRLCGLALLACSLSACTLQPAQSTAQTPTTKSAQTAAPLPTWVDVPVTLIASGSQATLSDQSATEQSATKQSATEQNGLSYQAATTQAQLNALWRSAYGRQTPMPAAPRLNSTQTVIGIFMGTKSTGGYGLTVTQAQRSGDVLRLRVQQRSPQPGTITTQALTSPWVMVAVPGQFRQILLEQGRPN